MTSFPLESIDINKTFIAMSKTFDQCNQERKGLEHWMLPPVYLPLKCETFELDFIPPGTCFVMGGMV